MKNILNASKSEAIAKGRKTKYRVTTTAYGQRKYRQFNWKRVESSVEYRATLSLSER